MTATRPQPVKTKQRSPRPRLPYFVAMWRSDIGKKWAMAVTGIIGLAYVVAHMIGNLHVYLGEAASPEYEYEIDHYGESLRDLLVPIFPRTYVLWGMRIVLIAAVVIHVWAAVGLALRNRRARGGGYRSRRRYQAADYASRTMLWGGIIVLLFILFHLADLTWGPANPDFVRGAVYHNMVASFERVPVAALYVVANLALGLHIYHGAWSMFQSLGINNPRFNPWRRYFAVLVAGAVTAGNVSFPLMVQFGVVS